MALFSYKLPNFGHLSGGNRRVREARPHSLYSRTSLCVGVLVFLGACATAAPPTVKSEGSSSRAAQREAQKIAALPEVKRHKRKIAIGRFTNETRYGRSLLRSIDGDPLGKQALDILSGQLVSTGRFLVFERPDLTKIEREQERFGNGDLVGVDVLIFGSITGFGRSTTGKVGFLSSTKRQLARASVDIRLVEVRTGRVFFSTSGSGEATMEAGEVAGFGSRAAYDATLNDKALAAAIGETVNQLVTTLEARPWRTDILKVEGGNVFISGGLQQGLKVGDELILMREGERIRSAQSGMDITLPGQEIGRIRVTALFGDNEANEGSVASLIRGSLKNGRPDDSIYVTEPKQ